VRAASRERKIEFLKSKGLEESQIAELLAEANADAPSRTRESPQKEASKTEPPSGTSSSPAASEREAHPPIVTYPEFLTGPARPPPLVTMPTLLNTLYAFGGLSTLIYGANKYVLTPMVESLTEARLDLHGAAAKNLSTLVEKLEGVVSEKVPPAETAKKRAPRDSGDNTDSESDPAELFHRDIGVQTSLPSSPVMSSRLDLEPASAQAATAHQARRIVDLVASVRAVGDALTAQGEKDASFQSVLDDFKAETLRLNQQATMGGYWLSRHSARIEPDDEIRKAKENVRRLKGVLLSARSFPALTR